MRPLDNTDRDVSQCPYLNAANQMIFTKAMFISAQQPYSAHVTTAQLCGVKLACLQTKYGLVGCIKMCVVCI